MKPVVCVSWFIVAGLLGTAALADTVVFRTERGTTASVEAQATRVPQGWQLRIAGEGGPVEMTVGADKVVRVIPATAPAKVEDPNALIERDPRAAAEQALNRWRSEPASREQWAQVFRRAMEAYFAKTEGLVRSNAHEQALTAYGEARRLIDTIEGRAILDPDGLRGKYHQRLDEATTQTRIAYSRYLADRGIGILERGDLSQAKQAMVDLETARSLDPTNALAWLGLAMYYRRPGATEPKSAQVALFAATMAMQHATDDRTRTRAQDIHRLALRDFQVKEGFAAKPPQATGSPQPTPAAGTPVAAGAATAKQRSILERLQARDWSAFGDIGDAVLQGEYLGFIIGVPAFIVIFWIVPGKFLRARTRKGDITASLWLARVRYLGTLTLIGYLLGSVRLPARAKERCPVCRKPIDRIEDYADFNFQICPHCGESITPIHSLDDYVQHLVEQLEREVRRRRSHYAETTIEKDATLKLVRAIVTRAARSRASDLHIDVSAEGATIRSRIDGVLYDTLFLPKLMVPSVTSAIKVMASLDIAERRMPQDGKFAIWVDKADVDVRVNTSPAVHGEKVSMRLLDKRTITVGPAGLGFEGQQLAYFDQAIRRPHGLLIVTGPAGCGKSTTLYVALNIINTGEKNIITLEDPIEYELKGITQMQVNPAVNFTFATGLRSIVRQDPNVIMVGEVRDKETAEMAIDSAITGHLVMTTMHTIDSTTLFTRLVDMGIDTRRYASALVIIIAQRLLRVNCPKCRKPYQPDPKCLAQLRFDQSAKDIIFLKGEGCAYCQQTGYYGRSGLFEILVPDREIRILLEQNASASKIREQARHRGMRNIREEGVLKVMRGQTTVEEVVRATM
jgi:type II secretory ATPase GspE/PulE/Tfp pilus assembly ATPase PilB-like protein